MIPTGTLIRNTQRQEKLSVISRQGRPQDRRRDGGDRGHPERLAALRWLEGVEHDRLLSGLQAAAGDALQQPEQHNAKTLRDAHKKLTG